MRTSLEGGAPKVEIAIDEEAANLVGVDLTAVARQLQAGLDGVVGGSLIEDSEQLPVRVRLGDGVRADLARIANLPVIPPAAPGLLAQGTLPVIPLSALAEVTVVPSDSPFRSRAGMASD